MNWLFIAVSCFFFVLFFLAAAVSFFLLQEKSAKKVLLHHMQQTGALEDFFIIMTCFCRICEALYTTVRVAPQAAGFCRSWRIDLFLAQKYKLLLLKHGNGKHLYLGIWQHSKYCLKHFSRKYLWLASEKREVSRLGLEHPGLGFYGKVLVSEVTVSTTSLVMGTPCDIGFYWKDGDLDKLCLRARHGVG